MSPLPPPCAPQECVSWCQIARNVVDPHPAARYNTVHGNMVLRYLFITQRRRLELDVCDFRRATHWVMATLSARTPSLPILRQGACWGLSRAMGQRPRRQGSDATRKLGSARTVSTTTRPGSVSRQIPKLLLCVVSGAGAAGRVF